MVSKKGQRLMPDLSDCDEPEHKLTEVGWDVDTGELIIECDLCKMTYGTGKFKEEPPHD
jgi:hypothetical protein